MTNAARISARVNPRSRSAIARHARDHHQLPRAAFSAAILAWVRDPDRRWIETSSEWPTGSIYLSDEAAKRARLTAAAEERSIQDVVNSALAAEAARIRKIPKKPMF